MLWLRSHWLRIVGAIDRNVARFLTAVAQSVTGYRSDLGLKLLARTKGVDLHGLAVVWIATIHRRSIVCSVGRSVRCSGIGLIVVGRQEQG